MASHFPLSKLLSYSSPLIEIIDIGASYLEHPPYLPLIESGVARLTGFDPSANEIQKLKELFPTPHRFFPFCIGSGAETEFHETSWVATGSLLRPKKSVLERFQGLNELTTWVKTHQITSVAIDEIIEIEQVDYIKIDIQGAELLAFYGMKKALKQALVIHTEVEFIEMYEGQPLFSDVDIYLRARGFRFAKYFPAFKPLLKPCVMNNDPYNGNFWVGADALYLKDWHSFGSYDIESLIKYSFIAHDVYKLYDFTYVILSEIERRTGESICPRYLSEF